MVHQYKLPEGHVCALGNVKFHAWKNNSMHVWNIMENSSCRNPGFFHQLQLASWRSSNMAEEVTENENPHPKSAPVVMRTSALLAHPLK